MATAYKWVKRLLQDVLGEVVHGEAPDQMQCVIPTFCGYAEFDRLPDARLGIRAFPQFLEQELSEQRMELGGLLRSDEAELSRLGDEL